MGRQNPNSNKTVHAKTRNRGNAVSIFLSSVAVLLSTLALVCGGYAAYEAFSMRQELNAVKTDNKTAIAPNPIPPFTPPTQTPPPSQTTASPSPQTTTQASTTTSQTTQPGQFIQPAFSNKAEVELLSVNRIKDPETSKRDVVNVQMRIRRLAADGISPAQYIGIDSTTARNPNTNETYKPVSYQRSTGSVSLYSLRTNASADAYVWLRIPETVNTIDIFVPDTAPFQKVPIAN